MTLNKDYTYKIEITPFCGDWNYIYSIVTAHGGVHLWVRDRSDSLTEVDEDLRTYGGLEFHWRTPPPYMKDKAPSHAPCWLLEAPCWHDGSSLQATENYIPRWRRRTSETEVLGWLLPEINHLHEEIKKQ